MDLADVENRLAAARRAYNAMIQTNNTIQQFPTVFIARIFGFGAHEFFNVNEEREALVQKPTVKF